MQMNDSQRIPASKEAVWAALNDPEILKQCIPGCQSLDMSSPTEMTATVVFRVGPVKATFGGKVLVDRETREICANAVRRFENLGAVVEEAAPDLGGIGEAFLVLRSQHYVVDRELLLKTHRHLIKPDISGTPSAA